MSEEYQKYEAGEPVIYVNGTKVELGIVNKVCGDDEYFVNYHTGDTAARTHARHLSKISNRYAYHIVRLDPDGKERKRIVGTTTVDEAFEKLLLDNCPEVKKKLRAFEIIKRLVKDLKTNASMDIICVQNPVNPSIFIACEDIEYDLRCETQEELDLLEEVMK